MIEALNIEEQEQQDLNMVEYNGGESHDSFAVGPLLTTLLSPSGGNSNEGSSTDYGAIIASKREAEAEKEKSKRLMITAIIIVITLAMIITGLIIWKKLKR